MKRTFLILFFIILLCAQASAVGISPPRAEIPFEAGKSNEVTFEVINTYSTDAIISLNAKGDLDKKYFKLSADTLELGPHASGTLTLSIKPLNKLDPGRYGIFVSAFAKPKLTTSGIGGYAQVTSIVVIVVPYPGKYITTKIEANDVSEGDEVGLLLSVKSNGEKDIDNIEGRIEIADETLAKIAEIPIGAFPLKSQETMNIKKTYQLQNKSLPGTYTAVALLNYDGIISTSTTEFKVGTLLARLVNYTKELEVGKINRFSMEIQNRWNKPILGLYATINLSQNQINAMTLKTPAMDLPPFATKEMLTYIDTTGLKEGAYDARIELSYEGKTTIEDVKINVYKRLEINMTSIMIAVIALIIIIDIIVILRRKRHAQGAKQHTEKR